MGYSVSFIGSGKVANQLAQGFYENGVEVVQIYGRNLKKAHFIAESVNAEAISHYDALSTEADVYIIAVKDDAISEVQASLPEEIATQKIVVHTSGFNSIDKLDSIAHPGIFYPLNTFAEGVTVELIETPFFIDAELDADLEVLYELAHTLSEKVEQADDDKRAQIHIAAVIVSNFSLALVAMGEELMEEVHLSMQGLKPLMERTYENALRYKAAEAITGPAVRGDIAVVQRHLRKLKNHPDIEKIYALMSQYITDKMK